jgi:hypothetical protein
MSLSLIKNDRVREKRIVPRFPLKTMAWRCELISSHALLVKDISYTGMQIGCAGDINSLIIGKSYEGTLKWGGDQLKLKGKVRWVKSEVSGTVFGLEFDSTNGLAVELRTFLRIGQISKRMRLINKDDFSVETPTDLKYWLKSDGPGEIFFWQHRDGEFSKIQLLILDKLIEWIDGEGLKTGLLVENRNIESPLSPKEEILFDMDEDVDLESLQLARDLISDLPSELIPENVMQFLQRKLGH